MRPWGLKLQKNNNFTICSDGESIPGYPATENWQKALGAHVIWGYAEVYVCGDYFDMNLTLHAIDCYNFNKESVDIKTGLPDNANGRFATLGWAKSFLTRGKIHFSVSWEQGFIKDSKTKNLKHRTRTFERRRTRRDRLRSNRLRNARLRNSRERDYCAGHS